MIPWIPLSVLSDLAQPRTAPADDVLPPRYPLGFSDVRAQAAPALADPHSVERSPIGFAPAPVVAEPAPVVFRTEISFRRTAPLPMARADAAPSDPADIAVGHASVSHADLEVGVPPVTGEELWPGEPDDEPSASVEEEKVPFFKREIGPAQGEGRARGRRAGCRLRRDRRCRDRARGARRRRVAGARAR
jgi:hypothetical protein